jgi:multidrug efflux pump subunit AcrA (membrane-fusion protein)
MSRTSTRNELVFLTEGATNDTLAQLVMDLGAQLHQERQARLALEEALIRAGVLAEGATAALAEDAALLARARAGLDASMARIMRIMVEAGDRFGPLRDEAPLADTPRKEV